MKHDPTLPFHLRTAFDPAAGAARLDAERRALQAMAERAAPPVAMSAAPAAPARGAMQLVPNWIVNPGGTRQRDGAHWVQPCPLDVMQASRAATDRRRDPEAQVQALFSPGHIAIAEEYRTLVEWRDGSAMKCASMEAGRGGSQGGVFIDSFIAHGERLDDLRDAIGDEFVMAPRRHMDRDNARRSITVRTLVDGVLLHGKSLSDVLTQHGWAPKGEARKMLREALVAALDRMRDKN